MDGSKDEEEESSDEEDEVDGNEGSSEREVELDVCGEKSSETIGLQSNPRSWQKTFQREGFLER